MRLKKAKQTVQSHKAFLRRQKVHENKYKKKYYAYLQAVNKSAADAYENGSLEYDIYNSRLEAIYKQLYTDVTIQEAEIQWHEFDDPSIKQQKDLIDSIVSVFSSNNNDVPINLWRSLLNDFLTVRIAGRISEVIQTTRKRIAFLIEKGIEEGLGAREVARTIRKDTGFNKNRSLAIARTETITSANQGKYMAASSSPYVKRKRWIATEDERTRASHREFLNRTFIDLDQMFLVSKINGGVEEAKYPCDNTLSAENVVNCRCSMAFENKKDANGRLIRKTNT